ncbi:hypothetical protein [Carboxylicivirga taeanensis]|uniref:hypothetical protein n=1 Tax=Carboxylicivirga taeanensis TaxID=1416875 RepID=UPI003F6DEE86
MILQVILNIATVTAESTAASTSMNSEAILSIVTISISTILSIGAIILSIWFYKESTSQNKETALMQTEMKNAVEKLEQLYNRTYTDTFGALKTQLSAMQKHIFTSSVGDTDNSEPNQLRFSILGCVTDKKSLTVDELCTHLKGFQKGEIIEMICEIQKDGIVDFNGTQINTIIKEQPVEGVGEE